MKTPSTQQPFDPLLRMLHAWNAIAMVGLIATALLAEAFEHGLWEATLWRSHVQIGYALIGGLLTRLLWGLFGPEFARWSDLWHPEEWMAMLRGRFRASPRPGHDAGASAVFLVLYLVLFLMAASGSVLASLEYEMGPLAAILSYDRGVKHFFKEIHEAGFAAVLGFIALHLGALAVHRFVLRAPVGPKMVGGMRAG